MAANLPTYFNDTAEIATRSAELPSADFDGGMNKGTCQNGVGINTGNFDPKLEDWEDSDFNGVDAIPYPAKSQYIGLDPGANDLVNVVQGADVNDTVEFVVAQQDTAPGDGLGAAGAEPLNRTGQTVPTGARAWGTNTVA